MIYELRQYVIKQGRMAECHQLFADVLIPLFHEVGIATVAFWEPLEPDGRTFIYLLAFDSAEAREASWPKFMGHEKWLAQKASWNDDPPYETTTATVLSPTAYSAQPPGQLG